MKSSYRSLSLPTRKWFNAVNREYGLEEHHKRLLLMCCQAWDRAESARQKLKDDGLFFTDRFEQEREHPAAKTERDSMIVFARLLRELGLDLESPKDTRPPGRPGGY